MTVSYDEFFTWLQQKKGWTAHDTYLADKELTEKRYGIVVPSKLSELPWCGLEGLLGKKLMMGVNISSTLTSACLPIHRMNQITRISVKALHPQYTGREVVSIRQVDNRLEVMYFYEASQLHEHIPKDTRMRIR